MALNIKTRQDLCFQIKRRGLKEVIKEVTEIWEESIGDNQLKEL